MWNPETFCGQSSVLEIYFAGFFPFFFVFLGKIPPRYELLQIMSVSGLKRTTDTKRRTL